MAAQNTPRRPGPRAVSHAVPWLALCALLCAAGCGEPGAESPADAGLDRDSSDAPDRPDAPRGPDAAADSGTDTADATGDVADDGTTDAAVADIEDATEPDADQDAPGSWAQPIPIDRLPFAFTGDTRRAPSSQADRYSCAPDTNEAGGEFVFAFSPDRSVRVRIAVDDVRGDDVDIDIHLLGGPSPDRCAARHDIALTATVDAPVWIVADTWVNGEDTVLAGPFTLTVAEVDTDPGDCLTNPIDCQESDTPAPNGVPTEPAGLGGCPPGMAPVADFCVDRWEAALVTTAPTGAWSPFANPGDTPVRGVSAPGLVPQGYITQRQATAACEASGKRLCTDDEWLRACQGAAGQTFPYGPTHEPGRCNEGRVCHPVVQYFESGADWIWSELGHPCINQLPDGLGLTGSHASCTSEDGLFDMHGNLHEWTANPTGIFRGGFYVDASINGPGCLYRTTAHSVGHWDYSTGFRCCAD
jgi:formylglycine-generating enzyme